MAVTKITVDGVEINDLTTPVRVNLSGSGKHKVQYTMDTDTIKERAFLNCDIEKITIPDAIKEIKEDAFKDSSITEVVLQGTTRKTLAQDVIPQEATLIASNETVGYYSNAVAGETRTSNFVSEIPVGYVLYERSNGELYAAAYSELNTDTPLGVCVIPKGLFDEHAHFIGLENLAYDDNGNVIHPIDYYHEWTMFGPRIEGGEGYLWWLQGIECYSQVPYCGLLYHTGEKDEPIYYNTIEEMPDIVGTDKPSGNMKYTTEVTWDVTYDILGVYDWSLKERTHFVECCQDSGDSMYVLPGGMTGNNPYYKGGTWPSQTIMPCAENDLSNARYFYDRHYYAPSPYLQVSSSDEVTANPILTQYLQPSELTGDRGNPFRFYGSANEFLIPNIISKCVKPQPSGHNADYDSVYLMGTSENGQPTFFPAPYLCYEYAPGTGGTQHQWALGTPLEWICTFAKITLVLNVLARLKCPLDPTAQADYVQGYIALYGKNSGWYWGGLMANEGMCFLMDANSKRVEDMITTNQPRLSTRPFIVL